MFSQIIRSAAGRHSHLPFRHFIPGRFYQGRATFSFAVQRLSRQECRDSLLETDVLEHGVLEGLPGEIRIGNATEGSLDDAGVGGTEALEGGFPTDLSPLLDATPDTSAQQIGGPGNPSALEGVDSNAPWIAEDGVVEGESGGRS